MKKRLLITSIVMMLVVAVALSTATYAWFTSNANVTATSLSMTAATNSAASIGISWTDGSYGTTIAATSPAGGVKFAPTAIDDVSVDVSKLAETVWSSATIRDVASTKTFNTAYATTVADNVITTNTDAAGNSLTYTWQNSTASSNTIYIHNGSTANVLSSVTAKATITGEAREFIRIAIYRKVGNDFVLKGIMTDRYAFTPATGTAVADVDYYNVYGVKQTVSVGDDVTSYYTRGNASTGGDISQGTVTTDHSVTTDIDTTTYDATASIALGGLAVDNGAVGGDDVMLLKVIVWMDGTALNDDSAGDGKVASIDLDFDAVQ